ncbi:MAG: tRNA-dihydrouridine synthase [Motiliproteus sp.]
MKIILAPMEGVVDPIMRHLLTGIGGLDRCVTEFVRVSDRVLPSRVFYRLAPELYQGGRTTAGVPVYVQLLGSQPEVMAENALRAAMLGAPGIDLNFGCPAKTVNRNKGGSILLKEPELVHQIVCAVRKAVPDHIPVTAKMRLGYEDDSLLLDNAQAIASAGAAELCIHARTKVEGYRPPAHWHLIAKVKEQVAIKVVANGDVMSPEDYHRCRDISGCSDIMIGRALLQWPDLGRAIIADRSGSDYQPMPWSELRNHIGGYLENVRTQIAAKHGPGRIKQWLAFLRKRYPEAALLFDEVKKETCVERMQQHFQQFEDDVVTVPAALKKAG